MNFEDESFVRKCLASNAIHSPCLEVGVGVDGSSLRRLIESAGITYFGADLKPHQDADFVFDLEDGIDDIKAATNNISFASILILNVLEHTFEPVKILDKVMELATHSAVVIVPCSWPLHDWPFDCWRILPNFYEEYAKRRGYKLRADLFDYVGKGAIKDFTEAGQYQFPSVAKSPSHNFRSRLIHKLFNTSGRGIEFSNHLSIGAVLEKPI